MLAKERFQIQIASEIFNRVRCGEPTVEVTGLVLRELHPSQPRLRPQWPWAACKAISHHPPASTSEQALWCARCCGAGGDSREGLGSKALWE